MRPIENSPDFSFPGPAGNTTSNGVLPAAPHASLGISLMFHIERLRIARCIADHGTSIIDDWSRLIAVVCDRELKARSIPFPVTETVRPEFVTEIDTLRGLEDVFSVSLNSPLGSALLRLSVDQDEFGFHSFLDDCDWIGVAHNLLSHEVPLIGAQIEVMSNGGRLAMRVVECGRTLWKAEGVDEDLGAIAAAVASFG